MLKTDSTSQENSEKEPNEDKELNSNTTIRKEFTRYADLLSELNNSFQEAKKEANNQQLRYVYRRIIVLTGMFRHIGIPPFGDRMLLSKSELAIMQEFDIFANKVIRFTYDSPDRKDIEYHPNSGVGPNNFYI